jgi:hypothetical protein
MIAIYFLAFVVSALSCVASAYCLGLACQAWRGSDLVISLLCLPILVALCVPVGVLLLVTYEGAVALVGVL